MLEQNEEDPLNPASSILSEPDLSILETAQPGETIILKPDSLADVRLNDADAIKKLPDLDVDFKLVTDQSEKIVSLKEIDDQISGSSDIDLARAEVVNEAFKDLFDSHLPRSGFSLYPTKTNKNEIGRYIKSKLAIEEAKLIDLFKTYVGSPYKRLSDLLQETNETYYPGFIRSQTQASEELEKLNIQSKETVHFNVLYKTNEFICLSEINLLDLNVNEIKTPLKTIALMGESIGCIQNLFKETHFSDFFYKTIGKSREKTTGDVLTIPDIYEFEMKNVVTMVEELKQKANMLSDSVLAVVNQCSELSSNPEKLNELIVKESPLFNEFHKQVTMYVGCIYHTSIFNLAVKQLLMTYAEL